MDTLIPPSPESLSPQVTNLDQRDFKVGAEKVVARIPVQSEKPAWSTDQKGTTGGTTRTEPVAQSGVNEIQKHTTDGVNHEISQVRAALFIVFPKIAVFWTSGVQGAQVAEFASLVRSMIKVRQEVGKL
jgi:hypothetical protein